MEAFNAADLEAGERRLLKDARAWMARLPFSPIDVLVVEEIGKNVSGSGMDTNVIGRPSNPHEPFPADPKILWIVALDLTEESHGNATGIGNADFTTRRLAEKIDWKPTAINTLTACAPNGAKLPLVFESDREAVENALNCIGLTPPERARVIRIRSTLVLGRDRVLRGAPAGDRQASRPDRDRSEGSPSASTRRAGSSRSDEAPGEPGGPSGAHPLGTFAYGVLRRYAQEPLTAAQPAIYSPHTPFRIHVPTCPLSEEEPMGPVTRRQFLTTTGTGLAGILATRVPPARGQQREISYLCWNNFAPASDKKMAEIGQRFTKDTGIKLKIDHISHMGPQQAKYAAEVQTQAGHDLVEMRMHFPWLYEPQLVDVSDVVAELEKKYGKAIVLRVRGRARQGRLARGAPVPRHVRGHLPGGPLQEGRASRCPTPGRTSTRSARSSRRWGTRSASPSARTTTRSPPRRPVLWSFGGMEVDKDGKTVRINSPATVQTIEWYQKMFRDCMEPEVLSWSDASNNESIQQGKAGWIHNPVSAYIVARAAQAGHRRRHQPPPEPRRAPRAPRDGRAAVTSASGSSRRTSSPSKEWIRYLLGKREVYDEYIMSG